MNPLKRTPSNRLIVPSCRGKTRELLLFREVRTEHASAMTTTSVGPLLREVACVVNVRMIEATLSGGTVSGALFGTKAMTSGLTSLSEWLIGTDMTEIE